MVVEPPRVQLVAAAGVAQPIDSIVAAAAVDVVPNYCTFSFFIRFSNTPNEKFHLTTRL